MRFTNSQMFAKLKEQKKGLEQYYNTMINQIHEDQNRWICEKNLCHRTKVKWMRFRALLMLILTLYLGVYYSAEIKPTLNTITLFCFNIYDAIIDTVKDGILWLGKEIQEHQR